MDNQKKVTTQLTIEQGNFKGDNGKNVNYMTCYIDVFGIQVKLLPKDDTSKQLIKAYYTQASDCLEDTSVL